MSYRQTPIVPDETYHIFVRSVARQPIFLTQRDYQRGLEVTEFYTFEKPSLRFSHYNRLTSDKKLEFMKNLRIKKKIVQVLAFCFMPNHVHFLLRESQNLGIKTFISNFQNSYAKYFNTKNERAGAVFQAMFKAVRMETDEQFLHVARYIHLNPYSSYIVKDIRGLENYPWSSLLDYLGRRTEEFVDPEPILTMFPSGSKEKFKKFTFDQADYQRTLERIKHLAIDG